MIFPYFDAFKSLYKSPLILLLIIINLLYFFAGVAHWEQEYKKTLAEKTLLKTQGAIYATEIIHDYRYDNTVQQKIAIKSITDHSLHSALGQIAFRDHHFLTRKNYIYNDTVALNWWKKKKNRFVQSDKSFSSRIYGYSKSQNKIVNLITYQFFHSGVVHLLGNLLILFLVGSALESRGFGSLSVVTYVISGAFAAIAYSFFSKGMSIPLVGASGSISGLVGLYIVLMWRKPVKYFYYLFWPHPRWYGTLYLPAWSLIFFWSMGDIAGVLAGVPGFAGVAYWAHIGGAISGAAIGITYLGYKAAAKELNSQKQLAFN